MAVIICSMSVRVCELLISVLYLMYIDCVKREN